MPHYRNAPITEAIIDFQVRLPERILVDSLAEVQQNIRQRYPTQLEMKRAQIELRIGDERPATSTEQRAGWAFRSADAKRIAQARLDGFTFSLLSPYERWETFSDEARSLWSEYRRVASPEAVLRVGLRYVNRFDIQLPIRDFKDFFKTIPEISPEMPQGLAGFFMQLQIPYENPQSMVVLTQTMVPPPKAGLVSIALDIEISCANNIPAEDEAIWQLLNQLRHRKNDVFEACITDAARELIR